MVSLLMATLMGLSACATGAYLKASGIAPGHLQTLEHELQLHQWGGWNRVEFDGQVAQVQEQAMAHEQAGQRDRALQVLNLGLTSWPESGALLECRASLYGGMGYWRAAECDFAKATELSPQRASAWEALGRCRQELGLWNAARAARMEAQRLSLLP